MGHRLEIKETREGDTYVLALNGRLDTLTAPLLDTKARRIVSESRSADIVVEMGECPYVSSAGLRVIVAMQKRSSAGGSLRFRNVMPGVMGIFQATGFDRILKLE